MAHVSPSFHPARAYGGPTESLLTLCRRLVRHGCVVRVLTTDADGPSVFDAGTAGARDDGLDVRYCHRRLGESVAPGVLRHLPELVRWADVVHLTAVYSFPTLPTLLVCALESRGLVWTPRGALAPWDGARHRWLKRGWDAACAAVLPSRAALHFTSDVEAEASRRRFPRLPRVTIPNGVDVPDTVERTAGDGTLRLVFLGRLHPIKGIERMLDACQRLQDRGPAAWRLTVAGTGEAHYVAGLERRAAELGIAGRVQFVGAVAAEARPRLFAGADLAVVPSHSESFGRVVAEALAHGVPVVASHGTPWRGLDTHGCGRWVDGRPEALAGAVAGLAAADLRAMGERGRDWMRREYDWDAVAARMLAVYREVRG